MAFAGLADRYGKTYQDLYQLPPKSDTEEPFLEFAPDDPKRDKTDEDSRSVYPGTQARETLRLARFLQSPRGMQFLLHQAEMQTGNTFSETRVWDPLSAGSQIVPFMHIQRPLSTAAGTLISDTSASPASDGVIGSAGRLQTDTKNFVIANMMNAKGPTGLLNLILPGNSLVQAANAVLNTIDAVSGNNIVGVDQRPEIDFQGQYFSVATWRGFRPQSKAGDPLVQVGNQLLQGNIGGALNSLFNSAKQTLFGSAGAAGTLSNSSDNRAGFQLDTSNSGYRYFVTNGPDASAVDRYLKDVITFTSVGTGVPGQTREVPRVMMPWVNSPWQYGILPAPASSPSPLNIGQTINQAQNDLVRSIKRVGSFLFGGSPIIPQLTLPSGSLSTGTPSLEDPAESKMIYPDLSLKSRYNGVNAAIDTIPSSITKFIIAYKGTYKPSALPAGSSGDARVYGNNTFAGFGGLGIKPDYSSNTDYSQPTPWEDGFRNGNAKSPGPAYVIYDRLNKVSPIFSNTGDSVSNTTLKNIRDVGSNLIDFLFYDFVNSKVLPFRAFLTDINQSSTSNVVEQQYIGRIERNIIYVGVIRDLSFTFRVQAFSKDEMSNVWSKINYLQGLQFPAAYHDGFMVPPLVKLTMGSIFTDQPGYIKSMTYKFDDDGWEIDDDLQAPQGITVNVSYSIIEKQQMSVTSNFFPYGANAPSSNPEPILTSNVLASNATTGQVVPANSPDALPPDSIRTPTPPTLEQLLGG